MPNPARKPIRRSPSQRRSSQSSRSVEASHAVAPPPQLVSSLPPRRSSFARTWLTMGLMVLAALVVVLAYVRFAHPGTSTVPVPAAPVATPVPAAPATAVPVAPALPARKPLTQAAIPQNPKSAPHFPMSFKAQQTADEPAELAVFPQHGKALRVIRGENGLAGSVRLAWDGRDSQGHRLAPGVYYLRLRGLKTETVQTIKLP